MARQGYLNVRLDEQLMQEVHAIFTDLGLSTGDALTVFYHQVKHHRGLPFDVKMPNQETIHAMQESDHPENLPTYSDFAALRQDLGL